MKPTIEPGQRYSYNNGFGRRLGTLTVDRIDSITAVVTTDSDRTQTVPLDEARRLIREGCWKVEA